MTEPSALNLGTELPVAVGFAFEFLKWSTVLVLASSRLEAPVEEVPVEVPTCELSSDEVALPL